MAPFSFCHSAFMRSSFSRVVGDLAPAGCPDAPCEASSLLLHEGLLLDLHLGELAVDGVDVGGHGVELHAQAAGGLVHEVDGLVGQEAVGDVAVGERPPPPTRAASVMRTPWCIS